MRPIGPDTRDENIHRLATEAFDVLIVGGGITGAGAALDAASRGLRTALVERDDFASGTSSRSSKLVHGGLRYLAQYEFGLTWEAAHERDLLSRLAPHLIRPMQFLYPVFRRGRESRFAALGLTIYDVLSAVRGVPRHRRARAGTIRDLAPTLDPKRVVGAWTYWDATTDDARLVFELIRTAHAFGAVAANYTRVDGFVRDGRGNVAAAAVTDTASGRSFEIRAHCVINATGVWAGRVGALDDSPIALRPAKGIHLVVERSRLPAASACIVPSAARDRRSLFALPWNERIVLGTTDTEWSGSLDDPAVEQADVDYVLSGINKWLQVDLGPGDVLAAWAGLRPLRAGEARARTADLSRRHAVEIGGGGLVSVTGGKLTTYRRVARDAVDAACERLGVRTPSRTHRIRIGLAKPVADVRRAIAEISGAPDLAARLVATYGDRASEVIASADPELARPVAAGVAVTGAEIAWAVTHEMAVRLEDILARRTRLALVDPAGGAAGAAPLIAARAAGWDATRRDQEVAAYTARLAAERGPVAPPLPAVSLR